MSWFKCDRQTVRTSLSYGVAPTYVGMGADAGYWQGVYNNRNVIVAHENYGVHFRVDGSRLLRLIPAQSGDFWTDGSMFLYKISGTWYYSSAFGARPDDAAGIEVVEIGYNLPATSGTFGGITLVKYFPHWTCDTRFGTYTPVGGAVGDKKFGTSRWTQNTRSEFPYEICRAVDPDEYNHRRYISGDDGADFITYDRDAEVWLHGRLPTGPGTWWQTAAEPVPDAPFTLTEYRLTPDHDTGYVTTPTGLTVAFAPASPSSCPHDTTPILLVTPEIVT